MEATPVERMDAEQAARLLEATPAALRALLHGLPESWLAYQEEPEAWSPRAVVVHFIHNERTNWIPRARVILSNADQRRFLPFQQMPDLAEFEGDTIEELLAQFAALRAANLAELGHLALKGEDYARQGEHPVLGSVTLGQLLATWVVHDLNHLHQIAKTLARRYRQAVGPWRPNLAILDI